MKNSVVFKEIREFLTNVQDFECKRELTVKSSGVIKEIREFLKNL